MEPGISCVMLLCDVIGFSDLQSKISDGDLHFRGIERNPHITLLFGMKTGSCDPSVLNFDNFDFSDIVVKDISVFKPKWDFDVLKIKIESNSVLKANGYLCSFPYTSDFPDFQPHITIGYFKKGKADKYIKKLNRYVPEIKVKPTKIVWSERIGETNYFRSIELKKLNYD
jgi:2'-5' RNA ligase